MASSAKEKFEAAVKVIRGLPANGPFQPSHELMLKFYSYYKQATEGRCNLPKPSFWDVVNKKKWEAWTSLKDMEREKAMLLYVDELKKVSNHVKETFYPPEIVETMPQTEEVNVFLQKLDTFYEMVEEGNSQPLPLDTDPHNNNVKGSPDEGTQGHLPNGEIKDGVDQGEETDLNYSENLTMLLKQDMKKADDSTGVLVAESRQNAGIHNGTHSSEESNKSSLPNGYARNGFSHEGTGDDDDDDADEDEDDVEEEIIEDGIVVVHSRQALSSFPPPSASPSSFPTRNERDNDERELLARNGGEELSESETENEEFCDTSDEPVMQTTPQGDSQLHNNTQQQQQPLFSSAYIPNSSSTPVPVSKILHIASSSSTSHPHAASHTAFSSNAMSPLRGVSRSGGVQRRLVSDSMLVNASSIPATEGLSLNGTVMNSTLPNSTSLFADSSGASQAGRNGDMLLLEGAMSCRGGDEEEAARDRRRRGGGGHGVRGAGNGSGRRRGSGGGGFGRGGSDDQDRGTGQPFSNQGGDGSRDPATGSLDGRTDLNEQIVITLLRLQRDMSGVLNRLGSLEDLVKEGRREQEKRRMNKSWWWPLPDLSFKSAMFIILWPILLQVLMGYLAKRRRKFHK